MTYPTYSYEDLPRVVYGEGMTFVPVCSRCRRFVTADKFVQYSEAHGPEEPNATCAKCGRTAMPFEGWL